MLTTPLGRCLAAANRRIVLDLAQRNRLEVTIFLVRLGRILFFFVALIKEFFIAAQNVLRDSSVIGWCTGGGVFVLKVILIVCLVLLFFRFIFCGVWLPLFRLGLLLALDIAFLFGTALRSKLSFRSDVARLLCNV